MFSLFKKKTKLKEYLKRHGSDAGINSLFASRDLPGIFGYIFMTYAHEAVASNKELRKYYAGTNEEVIMYETAWFDFFCIIAIMDARIVAKGGPSYKSVLSLKSFTTTFAEIATLFENFSGFPREIAQNRLNEYMGDGFPLKIENIKSTYNTYLDNIRGLQMPPRQLTPVDILKDNLFEKMASGMGFHTEIRHSTMHVPLHDTIINIATHYDRADQLPPNIELLWKKNS